MKAACFMVRLFANSNCARHPLLLAFLLGISALPDASLAQTPAWPTKPVHIITGWLPGSNADTISRMLAEDIGKRVPQPIIVENRPGAAGTIGARTAARADPDGHTLLVATMVETTVVPPMTVQSLQYDPEVDLQPVTLIGKWPLILVVNSSFPANTMAELVAYAKARPGKLNYGSLGTGTINHFLGELFKISAGIDVVHVPYKSGSPMLTDLIGGQIDFAFDSYGSSLPLVQAGKVKILAVTGPQRLPSLAAVPTTAEAGYPAVVAGVWMGVFVPAKTPKNIVDIVHAEAVRALNGPMRKALEERAIHPVASTPEEFKHFIQAETAQKRQLAARLGIKAE
ncbi:MAG: tripartite tricarboxylate transporter substrate binding protein [Betaproteobacteria bacterium]